MQEKEQEFSLKNLFVPLTTFKAIHIIVIVGFIVFGNMLFNGFVWDDIGYIINNQEIHEFNLEKIFGPSIFNNGGYYRPLPAAYFAFLYLLFHDISFFYHFFQIIIHISNTILMFIFLKHFFKRNIALFASLIFLVHPMQVESVSFIAASVSPLFFLFGMIALVFSVGEKISRKKIFLIAISLLLSFLIKETGFLFLFLVLFYRFLFNKKDFLFFLSSGILITLIYFSIRFGMGGVYFKSPVLAPIARLSFLERLMSTPEIVLHYIKTFFFPINLAINQFWVVTRIDFFSFYFPLFVIMIFLSLLVLLGRHIFKTNKKSFTILLFFTFWFLLGIGMLTQILPLDMTVADRWFYFPMMGLLGILATALQSLHVFDKKLRKLWYVTVFILITLLGTRTIVRNTDWHDAITLYTHDSTIQDNFDIENALGNEYMSIQEYDKALTHFKRSANLFPYEMNLFNIGSVYEKIGDRQKAIEYYSDALKKDHYVLISHKHISFTYERLGYMLLLDKNFGETKKQVVIGLSDYPDNVNLWILLAVSNYKLQHQQEALFAAEKAKTIFPNDQTTSLYTKMLNNQHVDIPKE